MRQVRWRYQASAGRLASKREGSYGAVALGAGIGTFLHCVWCCVTARLWRATLALEFFLSLVGQAVQFVLPCLAPGSWLYVPSQVPLSLHTWSKKAPVLRRERKQCGVIALSCSPRYFFKRRAAVVRVVCCSCCPAVFCVDARTFPSSS